MIGILNSRYKLDGRFRLGLLVAFAMISYQTKGQQTALYAHYYLNPFLYNPALAGAGEVSSANFLYRKQWINVDGAPETLVFTLDGSLKNHPVGLGISFVNDITNIIGRTGGALSASYEVKLTPTQKLRFGLTFEALRNTIYFDRVRADDMTDPGILESVDAKTSFEGALGLSYSVKKLRIGFSGDQLLQNTINHEDQAAVKSLNYTFVRHYYTTVEYLFEVKPNLMITPQLLVRTVQGLKSQFDGYVKLDYKQLVWTNLIYRHGIGAGASFGFKLDDRYVFSYAYEFATSDLNLLGSATHEFMVGIRLHRSYKGDLSHVSANGNASGLQTNTAQQDKIDALVQQNEQVEGKLNRTERLLRTQSVELDRLRQVVDSYQQDLQTAIETLKADENDTTFQEDGYYVVVGAVRAFDDAKVFQRILKREADLDTKIVQNTNRSWYFIYSHTTDSVSQALRELKEIKEGPAMPFIIEIPWIYKKEDVNE